MKRLLTLLLCLIAISAQSQVTSGYHRVGQVFTRANTGVTAQIVPNATIQVTQTSNGANATIYSDPGLTSQISPPFVIADSQGNYDYYLPTNYCVTETISAPGLAAKVIKNICLNYSASGTNFNTIGSGVNTTATMIVGSGATLGTAGTGILSANYINGLLIPSGAAVIGSNSLAQLYANSGILPNSISGNSATATALASTPSLCATTYAPLGISANGNATGCQTVVNSFNGRIGVVVAQTGDYSYSMITGTPNFNYQTVDKNGVAVTQRPVLNFSSRFALSDSSSPAQTTIDLATAGTPGTYTIPTSLTTDAYGRVTSVTAGTYIGVSCGANGCYRQNPDGTYEEWGTTPLFGSGGNGGTFSMTLPHAYTNLSSITFVFSPITCGTTPNTPSTCATGSGGSNASSPTCAVSSPSLTTPTIAWWDGNTNINGQCSWHAWGY